MNHYIYGMYVRRRPLLEAFSQAFPYRNFDPHYSKGDGWVQEILYARQVPYLLGMTMPTASSDRATNALCHSVLLRPTRCPGRGHCRDIRSHSKRYIEMHNHSKTSLLHGTAKPTRASARRQGSDRFIPPWKAFDAHMVTLAQRADCKIHRSR